VGRRPGQGERSVAHILVSGYLNVASWIARRVEAKSVMTSARSGGSQSFLLAAGPPASPVP